MEENFGIKEEAQGEIPTDSGSDSPSLKGGGRSGEKKRNGLIFLCQEGRKGFDVVKDWKKAGRRPFRILYKHGGGIGPP